MKHSRFSTALLCVILALCALLCCACSHRLVNIVATEGNTYRNAKTGAIYQVLPPSYEPVARGEEYGRLDLAGVEFVLHSIPGLDSNDWLCSVWGDVYCSPSYAFTPFEQWDIDALYVCTNTAVVVAELTLRESDHPEAALCSRLYSLLQSTYVNGPAVYYPSYASSARTYTLRFATNAHPALYYSIKLIEYTEDIYDTVEIDGVSQEVNLGRTFLYDRYADRCVPVSDAVFRLLDGASLGEVLSVE